MKENSLSNRGINVSEACAYLKIYDVKNYPQLLDVNRREIRRYAGMAGAAYNIDIAGVDKDVTKEMERVMESCISEIMPLLTYKVSYRQDSIIWREGEELPVLPFNMFGSRNAAENLKGCNELVMFAATIGIGIDRLISKYSRISPVKALFLQAIGAERIEALCDLFNKEIVGEHRSHPRFSPGYGDLPLDVQKEFFNLLDCQRRLGLTLNESLLMSPSKSVTAFIGIEEGMKKTGICSEDGSVPENDEMHKGKCQDCTNVNCEFRQG